MTKSNSPVSYLILSPKTATLKKVSQNDCDNNRQPEIAMSPSKPEILTYLELS